MDEATPQTPPAPYLTGTQVARLLGVSIATVQRLADGGHLPCLRLPPNGWRRYRRADVDRFIEAHTYAPTEAANTA